MHLKDPFESKILGNNLYVNLLYLCDLPFERNWELIYRASQDGFKADNFHLKCDGKSPTLTILKATTTRFIFGGFTERTWDGYEIQKSDPNAFIFSLINGDNKEYKMKPNEIENSIFCSPYCGPSFGTGEIHIENNSNILNEFNSFSDLGDVYQHPIYKYGTEDAKSFLAGTHNFQLDEIEIYLMEPKF